MSSSEQRFHTLTASAPVGIFETDPAGSCTYVNDRWSELTGLTSAKAIGNGWGAAVHPADRERMEREWARFVDGEAEFASELRFVAQDGRERVVVANAVALRDENDTVVGHIGTITDMTERKRSDEELTRAYADLVRSNADLEQFAYAASHDLTEPLRVIAGFAELLERRYAGRLDDDADRFIASILTGVERMQGLIDALLEYSHVGRAEVGRSEVDVAEVVAQALEPLAQALEDVAGTVEVGELPEIMAEPLMLGQLFQNLVSNAIKFAGDQPPKIEISAERSEQEWRFDVRDHGVGIDPAQAPRAFEMFQRLHGRDYPGTGIGLAICKRIAERHGGRIWADQAEGGGSVFSFTVADAGRRTNGLQQLTPPQSRSHPPAPGEPRAAGDDSPAPREPRGQAGP